MNDPLHSDLEPHDAEELRPVADWLHENRPLPSPAFRGSLRRSLIDTRPARHAPGRVWLLATSSFGAGALLLAVAALGVAGSGPFAA